LNHYSSMDESHVPQELGFLTRRNVVQGDAQNGENVEEENQILNLQKGSWISVKQGWFMYQNFSKHFELGSQCNLDRNI